MTRHFLSLGHRVFVLDIAEEELKHTCDIHLQQYAESVKYTVCDLRDVQAIRATVKEAADWFGGHIDVLINNGVWSALLLL